MSAAQWATAVHILILAVWLGTDIATFTLSRRVVDPDLPPASRVVVARAMTSVEIFARLALPSMLATGLFIALRIGYLDAGSAADVLGWVALGAGAVWVGLVWTIHRTGQQGLGGRLTSVDLAVRVSVCATLWVAAATGFASDGGVFGARWLAVKVALLALIVSCGIAIRVVLKPFGAAFTAVASGSGTPDDDAVLQACIRRAQPFVAVIWCSLVLATVLAVGKPLLGQ